MEELRRAVEEDDTTLNQYINPAVAEKLATRRTAKAFFAARAQEANIERALAILDKAGGEPPQPGEKRQERREGVIRA